jgi:hypothetical protein
VTIARKEKVALSGTRLRTENDSGIGQSESLGGREIDNKFKLVEPRGSAEGFDTRDLKEPKALLDELLL